MTHPIAGQPAIRLRGQRLLSPLILAVLTVLLAGCDEPLIVMSGGQLAGQVVDPPADWTALKDVEIVQLETRPEDPYSINIWMVGIGADVYIATGDDPTTWSENIDLNPDVRLRIDDKIYELEAQRVGDNREKRAVAASYAEKYDLDVEDNWVLDGQVFRLDRR